MQIAIITGILVALFYVGWRLLPPGWLTVAINLGAAALVIVAEILAYAAAFDWRQVLPPEWAPWAVLILNIASIAARKRSALAAG